jgi:stage II sporulation protein M
VTRRRRQPVEGAFQEHGGGPLSPPLRPDQPSPLDGLDPAATAVLLPPPRPDQLPAAVATRVRRYFRRPMWRFMLILLGSLLVGVGIGLAVTYGRDPGFVSRDRMFSGATPADFTVAGIFFHNALVAAVPVLLFPVLFWFPILTAVVTGISVGWIAGVWQGLDVPNGALILVLIPHGVIEIPSFLIAGTIAWRMGWSSWNRVRFGGSWWTRVRAGARVALPVLAIVIAALAIAATIEVKVSPNLVRTVYPDL